MTIELKTLGIDVSKSSVTVHLLSSYPKGGLKSYWEKTRNKAFQLYPTFHSNPDTKKKQKSAFDFADYVNETKPDVAILEPTGNHYSRMKGIDTRKSRGKNSRSLDTSNCGKESGGKNRTNKSDAESCFGNGCVSP